MRANIADVRERVRGLGERLRGAPQSTVIIGLMLVVVGGVFLLETLVPWMHLGLLWPLALIVLGAYLLITRI